MNELTFLNTKSAESPADGEDSDENTPMISGADLAAAVQAAPKRRGRGRAPLVLKGEPLLPNGRKDFNVEEFTAGALYILDVDNSRTGGPSVVAVVAGEKLDGWEEGKDVDIHHVRGHKNLPPSIVRAAFFPGDEIPEDYTKKMAHWDHAKK